ncbi:MAG: translation initiation factor IF-2, partial [Oscillospiraceae bacterium]|nr:translation initiation factor IF-2 [Oscillospiraceae bacterium]
MSSLQKYRVRDVAKDFDVTAKVITEILTKYSEAPKSNMQALTDNELNIIFDVLTLQNQVESFENLMSEVYSEKKEEPSAEKKEEAPKKEKTAKTEKKDDAKKEKARPAASEEKKEETQSERKTDAAPEYATKKGVKTHVIDTRGGSVDLSKYDDRVDRLVPDKVRDIGVQKQKIKKNSDRRGQNFGNKRRQEEQDKMKKLEAQVQKKPQVTVQI